MISSKIHAKKGIEQGLRQHWNGKSYKKPRLPSIKRILSSKLNRIYINHKSPENVRKESERAKSSIEIFVCTGKESASDERARVLRKRDRKYIYVYRFGTIAFPEKNLSQCFFVRPLSVWMKFVVVVRFMDRFAYVWAKAGKRSPNALSIRRLNLNVVNESRGPQKVPR